MFVRIIATPPGEAPEEVRQAWLGLELPLVAGDLGPRMVPTGGVLTGPRTFLGKLWKLLTGQRSYKFGYVIDAPQALVLLAEKVPPAARWWRECAPHCWNPGSLFIFPADVCAEVSTRESGRELPLPARPSSEQIYPIGSVEAADKPKPRQRN